MAKSYLALVNQDFELNEEVRNYFNNQNIEIKNYYPRLCIIHLFSSMDLIENKPNYIEYIELDQSKNANQNEN